MYSTIGAFDAKAKLSELLKEVKQGQCYTITLRGVPVADLVPSKSTASHDVQIAIERMRSIKKIRGVSNEMLQELIAEGRR
ncbi:MAG: type II toxin-antitoxin system prevent-host-death family antitoxin [Gammaproteobacteria bacterium]